MKVKRGLERFVIEHYSLEHLGALQPFSLPSAAHTFHSASNLQEMASQEAEISKDVKDRVSSLLASEFSRKVQWLCLLGWACVAGSFTLSLRVVCYWLP